MWKIIGGDGKEYPATTEQVKQWIAEGRSNAQTRAQAEGSSDWKPLGEHLEFVEALATKAAGPQPPPPQTLQPLVAATAGGTGGPTVDIEALAAQINASGSDFRIGEVFGRAWQLIFDNFWLTVGACFIGALIQGVPFLYGVVEVGLFYLFLKLLRGQPAKFEDSFAGFSQIFVPSLLAGILVGLLTALGYLLCILPGLFLAVVWIFTWPILIEYRLDAWQAMELSRKVCTPRFWGLLGFLLLCILIALLGLICCYVGIFIAMPVITCAMACAYEEIFHPRSRAAAQPL